MAIPKTIQANAAKYFDTDAFPVGAKVRRRSWAYPAGVGVPQVSRDYGYVREHVNGGIWVYWPASGRKTEYAAFEIIPA